jgi:hypothetical protein
VDLREIMAELFDFQNHYHRCPTCGFIWQHGASCAGNVEAHTCMHCKTESWLRVHVGVDNVAPDNSTLCRR